MRWIAVFIVITSLRASKASCLPKDSELRLDLVPVFTELLLPEENRHRDLAGDEDRLLDVGDLTFVLLSIGASVSSPLLELISICC